MPQNSILRVAFLGKNATRGGSMRELSYIVKFLDKSRIQPMIVLPEGGDLLREYSKYAPTHLYPGLRPDAIQRVFERLLKFFPRLPSQVHFLHKSWVMRRTRKNQENWILNVIRQFQPDLIVRYYSYPISMYDAVDSLDIPNVQAVLMRGTGLDWMAESDLKKIVTRSRVYICSGKGVRDYVHNCWGAPLDKILTVCVGVDFSIRDMQMSQSNLVKRADLGIPDDALVIGSVGSFYYLKGVDMWVQAAAMLRSRHPDKKLKFLWIGGLEWQHARTVYGSSIMKLIQEHGLQDDVVITKDTPTVYPYMDLCDIYVQPSRDDAFPHAILEAMSLGKPAVSFPQGIALEDYARGALVQVNATMMEDLSNGITTLIENPALRAQMGETGRRLVHERFDVAESIKRYENVLVDAARLAIQH